jgi:hypothetical protein
MTRNISSKTKILWIDAVGDTGKFVSAILTEPDKYKGKTFCAAAAMYTMEEVATSLSKTTGKTVVYKQISLKGFEKSILFMVDIFVEANSYCDEFGYFGPDSKNLVAWAVQNSRSRFSTLEEYFDVHPFQLA